MRFLSIFFSLLLSGGCSGRFHSIEPSTRTPKLYERTDFTVLLTADYRNAYLQEEVALDMLIETPSGEERLLPERSRAGRPVSRPRSPAVIFAGSG